MLGLVWDFFCPKLLISCWEFNVKSWECSSQYCKISWENVGPSLGFPPTPKCCFYFGNLTPYYRSVSCNTESQIGNYWELFGILQNSAQKCHFPKVARGPHLLNNPWSGLHLNWFH